MSLFPPLVGPEELGSALGDPRVRIFDATVFLDRDAAGGPYRVRSGRARYEEAHLPGAGFADIPGELSDPGSRFAFTVPSAEHFGAAIGRLGVGNEHHVVAYAQESPMWATRLWWLLRYFGHDAASVLDGGLVGWVARGGVVEQGGHEYPASTFEAHPRPELLASLCDVKAVVDGTPAQLVNALSPDVFRGEGPGSYSRPGRIPGSVNVPWSQLVDETTSYFAPPQRLADAFSAAGVQRDEPVIAYCGGGISATVDLFALFLGGRSDARLYDGSLTEWSADPDLPLATG
jgi:thiosulfate/3-mercaptopyruvate sulfurtransferase